MSPRDQHTNGEANGRSNAVSEILLPRSACESGDPGAIVAANVRFLNALMGQGTYRPDELPINAMRSYHIDYYMTQVNNGGHGQFVGNSGWGEQTIRNISAGLRAMGAGPYTDIFDDLRRLMERDPDRANRIAAGGRFGEIDPAIKVLDDRFFTLNRTNPLSDTNARWLRSLPELCIIPDKDYPRRLETLVDANLMRQQRLSERRGTSLDTALLDRFTVAGRLLCAKAQCLPILSIGAGDPALTAPDGREAIGWHITTGKGRQVLFLFDNIALLCEPRLADGRPVTDEVVAAFKQDVEAGKMDEGALWAGIKTIETARIEMDLVHDAIEAARKWPVVKIADALLAKLPDGDTLKNVFAYVKHPSGQWIWAVETDKRLATFGITGDAIGLFDPAMKPLAKLSAEELRSIVPGVPAFASAPPPDVQPQIAPTGNSARPREREGHPGTVAIDAFLAKTVQRYARLGFFLSVVMLFLFGLTLNSIVGILLAVFVLAMEIYGIVKLRKRTAAFFNDPATLRSPEVAWLSGQLRTVRLATFAGLGFMTGAALVGVGLASNGILELIFGEVPTFSLSGLKIQSSILVVLGALALIIVGYTYGIRLWAKRKVSVWNRTQAGPNMFAAPPRDGA